MMIYLVYLIPVLSVISAALMYKQNGKKELLRMDLVQFIYAFVLMPVFFIWLKSFLYYLMKVESGIQVSDLQMMLIDTGFSVIFLYIFAFVVIHSLTKSFKLKSTQDPLYDIFEHSEFFHLWITHLVMYIGIMSLITVLAAINIFFPMDITTSRIIFYFWNGTGFLTGLATFVIIWGVNIEPGRVSFTRVMKLCFGLLFLIHVLLYFIFSPPFIPQYGLYWWSFTGYTTLVACSLFAYKSTKAQNLFEKIAAKFKHAETSIS